MKPQFEVGKEDVGRGGVVQDPALWRRAIDRVIEAAATHQLGACGLTASPLRGASAGNKEFLVWFRRGASQLDEAAYHHAFADGDDP